MGRVRRLLRVHLRPDTRRDPSVETLRGLACILLVAFHVVGATATEGLRVPDDSPWRYFADSLVYLRMPLFTFLSGVVYAMRPLETDSRISSFMGGKARRLLIPMAVYGTLFALAQTFLPGANDPIATPWYLWNILPVGPYWFLASMMWVFVFVAAFERAGLLRRIPSLVVVCGVVLLLDAMVSDFTNWLGFRSSLYLLPFFIAGVGATRFDWRNRRAWSHGVCVLVAVVLTAWTQLGLLGFVPETAGRHSFVGGALGITLCLSLFLTRWRCSLLIFIGAFSFSIYAAQVFGVGAMRLVLSRVGIENLELSIALCVLAGIVFPICLEIAVRRNRTLSTLLLGARWRDRRDGGSIANRTGTKEAP